MSRPHSLPGTGHPVVVQGSLIACAMAGALAYSSLACSVAGAADRDTVGEVRSGELRSGDPRIVERSGDPRFVERRQRMQELRRQLLEHNRHRPGGAVINQPPGIPSDNSSPGRANAAAASGVVPLAVPAAAPTVVPAAVSVAAPVASPAASAPDADTRLSDRERNQLRQQLRQVPRLQSPRRD